MTEAPKTIQLNELVALQLSEAWKEYLAVVQAAEMHVAVAVMLAGRVLRLQEQLRDHSMPAGPIQLLLAIEEPDEEDTPPEGATTQ